MKSVDLQIGEALLPALSALAPGRNFDPSELVKPCLDARNGDYQCNAAMMLAKELKRNPREVATEILQRLDVSAIAEPPQVAGAGFINFTLRKDFIASRLSAMAGEPNLGVEPVHPSRTIIVDFSAPNVAKQMHVGHIRSTVLGNAITRILRLLGHHVIADNHIGDWGTQFGKLLLGYKTLLDKQALETDPLAELERLYKAVNERCEQEEKAGSSATINLCRAELKKLQDGDAENLELWNKFIEVSARQFAEVYRRLNVTFDHALGESFYNPMLKGVVDELVARGIARESDGAVCVFSDGTLPSKDDPFRVVKKDEVADNPFLIQKKDGAALYATTDLATIRYRVEHFKADEILYVVDSRQQLHFRQLFATARRWGLTPRMEHVGFGTILGEDNRPIKTRTGEPVKLKDLLNEAEERAYRIVQDKAEFSEEQKRLVARVIGLGALKYADLGQNRTLDYVFSWDKLLALNGNTAPYLQNAYARIQAIFRKGGITSLGTPVWQLDHDKEVELAKHLLRFQEILHVVVADYRPHMLCTWLYELAQKYHHFYEHCPVLKAEGSLRESRLHLCDLTARTLQTGLSLLGIDVVEQM